MHDIVIRRGTVVDGTGAPRRIADVVLVRLEQARPKRCCSFRVVYLDFAILPRCAGVWCLLRCLLCACA